MHRVALLALALALAPGCYLSHRSGDGPAARPDAGALDAGRLDAPPTPRDAGPRPGGYWTLERRAARLSIPHELGCTQVEGGRIALEVSSPLVTECEHAGPIDVTAASDGTRIVSANVWVEHPVAGPAACRSTAAVARRTLLFPASEGTFRAVTADGVSVAEIRVGAIDDLPCTHAGALDAPCRLDCQCERGLVCIPELGDFVACEGGRCGAPCQVEPGAVSPVYGAHLDCAPFERCGPGPGGASTSSCRPIEDGGCRADGAACAAGLECPAADEPSECEWAIRLTGDVRHACARDADCDPGLFCVEHRTGERACEVPCFTNEMRCPFMHACRPERWVCEWLGE